MQREIARALERFGLPPSTTVTSCYEAGRDGFGLHRWVVAQGIRNVVVDSSSIEVNRRARRAKSDRLDATKLLHLLMRWAQGERKVWSVIHVPTPEAEAARQVTREIETVRQDRTRVRNRIQALLASQGIRGALTRGFAARIDALQTGDGRPLPASWRERLTREWAQLRGLLGLVTWPYRSDQRVQDQESALTVWFHTRFGAGGRSRRVGIVAVARKLMIALWRFAEYGVIPEGAQLKAI